MLELLSFAILSYEDLWDVDVLWVAARAGLVLVKWELHFLSIGEYFDDVHECFVLADNEFVDDERIVLITWE